MDEAIGYFQQAIRIEPDDFQTHLSLCMALMQKQSWDEAIAAAREAIRCKPDLAEAHCNLGRALQALSTAVLLWELKVVEDEGLQLYRAIRWGHASTCFCKLLRTFYRTSLGVE